MDRTGTVPSTGLIRSILLWTYFGIGTTILASFSIFVSLFGRIRIAHRIGRIWATLMNWATGTRIQIYGTPPQTEEATIYLCNHRSLYDIIVLFIILKFPVRWVAKESLFRIPIFGFALRRAGHIPVYRDDKKLAKKALFDSLSALEKGDSILMFPEGTRNRDEGTLLPFKKGAFLISRKAAVRIQPIVLRHTATIVPPRQTGRVIQRISGGTVEVHFLESLSGTEVRQYRSEELSDLIYRRMNGALTVSQEYTGQN